MDMEEKKMKKILGIPKNYVIPYSIVLGYPEKDDEQIVMDRKNIGEIILSYSQILTEVQEEILDLVRLEL